MRPTLCAAVRTRPAVALDGIGHQPFVIERAQTGAIGDEFAGLRFGADATVPSDVVEMRLQMTGTATRSPRYLYHHFRRPVHDPA